MFPIDKACELLVDLLPVQNITTLVRMSGGGLERCPEQGDQIVFEPVKAIPARWGVTILEKSSTQLLSFRW